MLRLQPKLPEAFSEASSEDLDIIIAKAKGSLGNSLLILGHHYQRDEVIKWADKDGDSLALARFAAQNENAKYIVFCGVHFMAESADILTADDQKVILPDLNAGCSMADMADSLDVVNAFSELSGIIDENEVLPITYINSSAKLKAFVGERGGAVCTSSNAQKVISWALGLGGFEKRCEKVFFFPDQHLGRNTSLALGIPKQHIILWDPREYLGGNTPDQIKQAKVLLWRGHCSIHQRFTPDLVVKFRETHPNSVVIVHPECPHETVELADFSGSTNFIVQKIEELPDGIDIGVGTEIHLVHRLKNRYQTKNVVSLDPLVCPCATMNRIDLPHLAWVLSYLEKGEIKNQITVSESVAASARLALETMLKIS